MNILVLGAATFGATITNELSVNPENDVDIFVMGRDWEGKFDELKEYCKEYCKVIYFSRTNGISTAKLKSILKD